MQQLRMSRPTQPTPIQYPMRFAGHFPDIMLPEPPTAWPSDENETGVQAMKPAPGLEPVFAEESNGWSQVSWQEPSVPLPSAVTVTADGSNDNDLQSNALVRVLQQLVADQTRVFQSNLNHLDATQRKFLNLQDSSVALLAGGREHGSPMDHVPLAPCSSALFPVTEIAEQTTSKQEPLSPVTRPGPSPTIAARPPAEIGRGKGGPPPQGPSFGRDQLLELSCGKVSSVFGPLFEQQDGYARQVRLPTPPLLLVDRITGIDARPGVDGTGTIWTETDVRWGEWYLQDGVMAAGVMIESGQADLTLISWMGADFENKGERVYRLLGCDLTYHGGLPRPGDTLRYDIHITGHAREGDVRLFFFQYDCRINGELRMTVRNGQAGFFTDEELANSSGILWSPETAKCHQDARLDPPRLPCGSTSFSRAQVDAWFEGRPYDCFGAGYENLLTHTRTPQGGSAPADVAPGTPCLKFFDEVSHCDVSGGPWGRGYLRVRKVLSDQDWFFQGHFHNDPCMPGTLMFEGALQAMAFYLSWLGFTLERDGWRFEPIPDDTYKLRCRGQAVPSSRELVCELFIEEIHDGDEPRLYAHLLGTVDGLKAFHCSRMGLRLVPDWPLSSKPELLLTHKDPRPFATAGDVRGDYAALLACAWGKPSDAFGSMFRSFDGTRRTPVLPGPPYHFMSRVTRIDAEAQQPRPGASIEAEYDVPADAWYFRDHGGRAMPFSVLMEVNLQPCGWLAMFFGFPLKSEEDLYFRNLDGTATVDREVLPEAGTLRTRVTLTQFSEFNGMVLVSFETACWLDERPVCRLTTSFGFFTREALAQQVGLPTTPAERDRLEAPGEFSVELTSHPSRYFAGPLRLPHGPLRMIDRILGYWPEGGKAGLGRLLAEQTVDPAAWYFKAHFYRDPVQPGSLGVEAMLQLLQFYMIEREMHAGVRNPVFEPIASGKPAIWKYRGQVLPQNKKVQVEMEVTETGRDEHGPYAVADAWLWVDGMRIYHARGLAIRVLEH
jgi:3-hydroxymyristoyl/3-hydroxydecanoyl-(acyl carrier protein) dehydratase